MGWPLRPGTKYREFGGSFIYPMGEDMVTLGMVVGLDYRDAELSVHDLLQELKTHPKIRRILEGGERLEWGAKTIPEGGFLSLPKRLHAPGLLLVRRRRRDGQRARAEGDPLRDRVGPARGRGGVRRRSSTGETAGRRGALDGYDESIRESFIWKDLKKVRNMRPAFTRGFWLGGALAGAMTASFGKLPAASDEMLERDAEQELITTDRAAYYPRAGRQADLRQALVRLRLREQDARRPAEPHPDRDAASRATSPRCGCACARRTCTRWARRTPARSTVQVTPSNCVQCGAITAKGGRLTPPEGGSGPEYTRT